MQYPSAIGSRHLAFALRRLMRACSPGRLWPYVRVLTLLALPAVMALPGIAQAETYPAAAVKAVFLYRFAGYVQWPQAASSAADFTIAVLGSPAVAAQLAQLLPGHLVQGKPVQVRVLESVSQLGDAQMLYIGADYGGDLRRLIAGLRDRPLLVVTDSPAGLSAGGTVNFLIDNAHVRFEVSTVAARRAGLRISSDLLAVAKHVETGLALPSLWTPLGVRYSECLRVARHGQEERG